MRLRSCILVLLICFISCKNGDEAATPMTPDTLVAQVGSYSVSIADLDRAVVAIFGKDAVTTQRSYEELRGTVDALIAARVLALDAERQGIDQDSAIVAVLDSLRAVLLKEAIYEFEIHANLPEPSEQALVDLYQEWGSGEQVLGAHILVRTGQEAETLIKRLDGGEEFADLARERSLHEASSRFGGGMGYLRRSQYPPAIADVIWSLQPGDHGPEPVHTSMGWHVVAATSRRTLLLEDQRGGLIHEFGRRQRQVADEAFVAWLRSTYEVVYDPSTAVAVASLSDTLSGHRRLFSWKGGQLTLSGFLGRVQVPDPVSEDTARMRILAEGLVFDELAALEADARGFSGSSDVRNRLLDKKLQLISQYVFEAQASPGPDREEVRAFFESHRESFRAHENVRIREILVDELARADSLYELILSGADMEALARRYTVRTDLAMTGGLWEDVRPGDPRSARIYDVSLEQGVGLHRPLKVNGGFSVFEVLQITQGRLHSFDEVEVSARASTVSFRMEAMIQRLRAGFGDVISIDDSLLKTLAVHGI